jgi:hypothetical protein
LNGYRVIRVRVLFPLTYRGNRGRFSADLDFRVRGNRAVATAIGRALSYGIGRAGLTAIDGIGGPPDGGTAYGSGGDCVRAFVLD